MGVVRLWTAAAGEQVVAVWAVAVPGSVPGVLLLYHTQEVYAVLPRPMCGRSGASAWLTGVSDL